MKVVLGTYSGYSTLRYIKEVAGNLLGIVEYPPLPALRYVVDYGPKGGAERVAEGLRSAGIGNLPLVVHGPHSPICSPSDCVSADEDPGHAKGVAEMARWLKRLGLNVTAVNYHAPYTGHRDQNMIRRTAEAIKILAELASPIEVTAEPQWFPHGMDHLDLYRAIREAGVSNASISMQIENEAIRTYWTYFGDYHLNWQETWKMIQKYGGPSEEEFYFTRFSEFFTLLNKLGKSTAYLRFAFVMPYKAFGGVQIYKKRVPWRAFLDPKYRPMIGPNIYAVVKALKRAEKKAPSTVYFIYTGLGIEHHAHHYDYRRDAEERARALKFFKEVFEEAGIEVEVAGELEAKAGASGSVDLAQLGII